MSTVSSTSGSSGSGTTTGTNSAYRTSSRLTGMFSSLDTDALVKSMCSSQQAKIDAVKQKQTRQQWYNDALEGVQDDVNDFLNTYVSVTGSSSMLKSASYMSYKTVTASTAGAVSISAASGADTGNITVQVSKLAANAYAASSGKVSKNGTEISSSNTATLGSLSLATPLQFGTDGKITFSINSKTFSFTKDTTLQSMINTINTDKTANVTMKYSRLTDAFTITADAGGADSSVNITNLKGNAFGTNSAFKIGTGIVKNGSDATAIINGTTVNQDSNTFTIDNITYNLKKVTTGTSEETVSFSIERDFSTTSDAVSKFVDAYNTLYKKLSALNSQKDYSADYPPLTDDQKAEMTTEQITAWETKAKSGLLRHNTDLENLLSNLKNAFYSALGGTGRNATDIGISFAGYFESNAGQIVFDKTVFEASLENNPDEVVKMFTNGSSTAASADQGLIYKLKNSITGYTSVVTNQMKTASTKITSYGTEVSDLEDKLQSLADTYYKKFSNMETALSKLNTQASYISQLFGSTSS
ncbi:flagellar filament capping protein FliD [Oscillospiraceae bacterium CM]|nr:flagellar filament capping protein FliD [Oscillospiraceae bacterium CM]